jgi:hypothetical protein
MKRRLPLALLFVALLVIVAVPVALAYTSASGTVTDANGDPWPYGGTVECRTVATNALVGSGALQPDGSWSVTLGSPAAINCTIDPAPGPNGDPGPIVCAVPGGGGGGVQNYSCGPLSTGSGPLAVSLSGFAGGSALSGWMLAPLAAVTAGVLALLRRR